MKSRGSFSLLADPRRFLPGEEALPMSQPPERVRLSQLLGRTGEMARRQEEGPNRKIFGAMARYLPALSGMRLL